MTTNGTSNGTSNGHENDAYPFHFSNPQPNESKIGGPVRTVHFELPNVRGRVPSLQASKLRSLMLEGHQSPDKTVALVCSYDGLSSRLVEEAGFPAVFLAGYPMAASYGLPDTGYIGFQEVASKIQEVARQVTVPIIVDGDTGYGSPMNVRRTVEGFAQAGAAGVMIEDQTWPKRCGHTRGKSVVSCGEAFARWQAAVDVRNESLDIWILARTDSYVLGYDEALYRARKAIEIGVDCVFVEALPDRATMQRMCDDLQFPLLANIIEGGKTENLSAIDLSQIGFCSVVYPWTLVAAHLKAIREALKGVKSAMLKGAPPSILSYEQVCEGVGFNKYWALEERYQFEGSVNGSNGYQFEI